MFIEKYQNYYAQHLTHRASTFRAIFEYLISLKKSEYYIIETGTSRFDNTAQLYTDGGSTFMYDDFISHHGGKFISIDIDPHRKQLCENKISQSTSLITQDSVQAIKDIVTNNRIPYIDFLYLDSYDIDWNNPHPSATHHMQELLAALSKLIPGSLVVVDDNKNGIGKGQYVAEYMSQNNKTILFDDYQIGWIW